VTVDPYEIEDTSDWLGCPTPLDTCRHQLRMLENEIQELMLQIRQARQNIFKLVEMHTEAANERDTLRSQLATAKAEAANANRHATEIETRCNWELMAKGKHISELTTKLRALTGQDQPVGLTGDR
jgi:regulator of replication initiation timing